MEFDKNQLESINSAKTDEAKEVARKFFREINDLHKERTYILELKDEPMPIMEQRILWDQYQLPMMKSGLPVKNENTIMKIFEMDPFFRDSCFYDEFQRCIYIKDYETNKFRKYNDADTGIILINLQRNFGLTNVSMTMVHNAMVVFAHQNKRDELVDYLNSLEWDGAPRIENFFPHYCGSYDKTYERTVSKSWWISIAARALKPGCKVDNMVILEGAQGINKSTMLGVIGGKWYAENTAEIGDKDFYQNLEGVLISEIAELDSFSKAGVTTIKRVITSQQDKYRPSYGRNTVEFKRRCVFVGTTNDSEYLKDDTGNRRYWPIQCKSIDLDMIRQDRDQLFAEAVERFKQGESWWIQSDVAHLVQESRRSTDPWEDEVRKWCSGRDEFTTSEILSDCLKISIDKQHYGLSRRVGKILRSLGFVYKNNNGKKMWSYFGQNLVYSES